MKSQITVHETLDVVLDAKCLLESSEGSAELQIRNVSDQTTMWGIVLSAKHDPEVSNFQGGEISHIAANDSHKTNYNFDVQPKLQVFERIDTGFNQANPDITDTSHFYLVVENRQRVLYEIELRNDYTFELNDITVEKHFPSCKNDISVLQPYPGSTTVETGPLRWDLPTLPPNSSAILRIVADLTPVEATPVPTGEIIVTCNSNRLFTTFDPDIDAECDAVDLEVDVKEAPEPDVWNILASFTNNSEFAVMIDKVTVEINGNSVIDVLQVNKVAETALGRSAWEQATQVHSHNYPQVAKTFKYEVLYDVIPSSDIKIKKNNDFMPVVKISSQKAFIPDTVNTYTRTPVKFTVVVKNEGSAEIGVIEMVETIPPFFDVKSVSSTLNNQSLSPETSWDGEVEGEELDISTARTLKISLETPNFMPNDELVLSVDGMAQKPRPTLDYSANSTVRAFSTSPTVAHKIPSLTGEETPAIIVAYKKRSYNYRAGYYKHDADTWMIEVVIVNNGEVPLENIVLTQQILKPGVYARHEPVNIPAESIGTDNVAFKVPSLEIGGTITVNIYVDVPPNVPIRQVQPSIQILD